MFYVIQTHAGRSTSPSRGRLPLSGPDIRSYSSMTSDVLMCYDLKVGGTRECSLKHKKRLFHTVTLVLIEDLEFSLYHN